MDKQIKIKLNAPLLNHKVGTVLTIQSDQDGIPYNAYWRRRLIDSKIDNCIEVIEEAKKSTENTSKKDK